VPHAVKSSKPDAAESLGIPQEHLPRHVAIIMDGNGRWARTRGLARIRGHQQGAEAVRDTTRACAELHLDQLTLYAFSAENWKRPKAEISLLMRLLTRYLVGERQELMDNDIRLTAIGEIERLPDGPRKELEKSIETTSRNRGMLLCLALSYGGRQDIVNAARRLAEQVKAGILDPARIDEPLFDSMLSTSGMPAPDLLIRTAGEMRVSNFLLWQMSYAEIYVTPVFWPDFRRENLFDAFRDFARRTRRFGGVVD
jgi:undecaprenyl diphosphate synthase